jgi:hypothetical protein
MRRWQTVLVVMALAVGTVASSGPATGATVDPVPIPGGAAWAPPRRAQDGSAPIARYRRHDSAWQDRWVQHQATRVHAYHARPSRNSGS